MQLYAHYFFALAGLVLLGCAVAIAYSTAAMNAIRTAAAAALRPAAEFAGTAVAAVADVVPLPVYRCRHCRVPIELNETPWDALDHPWRHHLTGRPACWIMPQGERVAELFGLYAEPPRRCSECGEPETRFGPIKKAGGACQDRAACQARQAALPAPCPCGSGNPAGSCPGRWHFAPAGAAR